MTPLRGVFVFLDPAFRLCHPAPPVSLSVSLPMRQTIPLLCPLDGSPLATTERGMRCPDGHTFDRARQGYVHLLPVQAKRSRAPGDSKPMVAARRRFLDSGAYRPIADGVAAGAASLAAGEERFSVLDAGCGEGYYLEAVRQRLEGVTRPGLLGVDISKHAVAAAAGRYKGMQWVVASNRQALVPPGALDLVLSLFGFPDFERFHEALRPGGHLLLADPGPDHLLELRRVIYPEVRRKGPPLLDVALERGWALEESRWLRFSVELAEQERIDDLMAMTPHLYRAPAAGREAAARLGHIEVTVEVALRLLRRL